MPLLNILYIIVYSIYFVKTINHDYYILSLIKIYIFVFNKYNIIYIMYKLFTV